MVALVVHKFSCPGTATAVVIPSELYLSIHSLCKPNANAQANNKIPVNTTHATHKTTPSYTLLQLILHTISYTCSTATVHYTLH